MRHVNTRLLRVVPLVRDLEVSQHLDPPGQDGDQQESDQQANPDRDGYERLAVPVGTEPEISDSDTGYRVCSVIVRARTDSNTGSVLS